MRLPNLCAALSVIYILRGKNIGFWHTLLGWLGFATLLQMARALLAMRASDKRVLANRRAAAAVRDANRTAVAAAAATPLSAPQLAVLEQLQDPAAGTTERVVAALRSGAIRSEDAVTALRHASAAASIGEGDVAKRAYLGGTLTPDGLNAVTALVDGAVDAARAMDEQRAAASAPSSLGVLHGVPVTIKECGSIKGHRSTIGIAKRCAAPPADEDCVLVQVLRAAGAVPFAQTNIPQTMLSFECSNPVFGVTRNPHNGALTPGGSSGGEACLLGARASLMGIGTDIGGSCRIPAHFCGVAGLKPTKGRLSGAGFVSSIPGQVAVAGTPGPMARDVAGLELMMCALCGTTATDGEQGDGTPLMSVLDPTVPPLGWDAAGVLQRGLKGLGRKLRVGVMRTDGFIAPTPACLAALETAAAALRGAGHEVEDFDEFAKLPESASDPATAGACDAIGPRGMELFFALIAADEGATVTGSGSSAAEDGRPHPRAPPALGLTDEDVDPSLAETVKLATIPKALRTMLAALVRALGWRRMGMLLGATGKCAPERLWALAGRVQALKARVASLVKERRFDVLLTPGSTLPACRTGDAGKNATSCNYTALFNLLDFPAGVLPVQCATAEQCGSEALDAWTKDERAAVGGLGVGSDSGGIAGADLWARKAASAAANAAGMPIGVQLVALPWHEEMCLLAMKEVERLVGFDAAAIKVAQ